MSIHFRLDYTIHQTARAQTERAAARSLTGAPISPRQARENWPHILAHKWYMGERMGRDVGMRVAAQDYFENVCPLAAERPQQRLWRRLTPLRLMFLDSYNAPRTGSLNETGRVSGQKRHSYFSLRWSRMNENASVWQLADAVPPEECRAFIAASERAGYAAAPLSYSYQGANGFAVSRDGRACGRAAYADADAAARLWARVADSLPRVWQGRRALGLNERLRFYRYAAGERLGLHRDGFYQRPDGASSLWTLLVYLNQDFAGGATYFARDESLVAPCAGAVLVFSHHVWHEGRPVTAGCKYVLRTDVMFAP